MHFPRCLDPKSQSGEHPYPHEGGGCYLGKPGHCRKCPHRGQNDTRFTFLIRAGGYAGAPDLGPRRPDTDFGGGRTMPQEVAEFLWPPAERWWIERDDIWAERARYHVTVGKNELIRELLREIHDLHADREGGEPGWRIRQLIEDGR